MSCILLGMSVSGGAGSCSAGYWRRICIVLKGVPMSQPQPRDSASGQQRYNINRQDAGVINNVGRNQHNSYVQQVHERESFLRAIAATRTKARWLVWTGLALFVVGFGLFAAGVLGFLTQA